MPSARYQFVTSSVNETSQKTRATKTRTCCDPALIWHPSTLSCRRRATAESSVMQSHPEWCRVASSEYKNVSWGSKFYIYNQLCHFQAKGSSNGGHESAPASKSDGHPLNSSFQAHQTVVIHPWQPGADSSKLDWNVQSIWFHFFKKIFYLFFLMRWFNLNHLVLNVTKPPWSIDGNSVRIERINAIRVAFKSPIKIKMWFN